ncbi:hypothetical protein C1H76_7326 [Elsinoe australis]|uniref:Phosphatidate phosphatase APP1 catalytic domain-containing protein n=1 Tax=Elsinoe australis TaxID=40998 RepID=A0A4U7AVN7_9PEZI|nr:hypothetical protein C1H76_7326 [Elsinoe australis]
MAYRSQADRGYYQYNNENSAGDRPEIREPGGRRKKLAGYLRAANELRQSYTQSWNRPEGDDRDGSSADFNNVAMVSTGEEQMILFPSYARRHVRQKPEAVPGSIQEVPGTGRDYRDTVGAGDAEFWKKQWEAYEDDRAIVDVDVRGWIFTPHKGQMSRKQRLMVALARQLVGIPAPPNKTSPSTSAASSRASSPSRRSSIRAEEELVSKEAAAIISKGEAEAEVAGQGEFSEKPLDSDKDSIYEVPTQGPGHPPRRAENLSAQTTGGKYGNGTSQLSSSGQVSMSAAELAIANANLMTRLKPFMANPLTSTTINAFFYNETTSRQKSVTTDGYGHFSFRAALDFIPTHVRVLAMEDLSISEEVKVVEEKGVSLVSDIDDTIRHSAVTRGAREIFRNAFIRDLKELTVEGVKEWYNKLADMGVQVHYVSNSPWQLFPVLTSFFAIAGLPRGSFHLKQYSGMLQGIFEPVAERKKATLERIFRDFPERRFILVGDSGEADLEVYTDVVMENPGRVIGVFIRDVTMPPNRGFFDPSMGPLSGSNTPRGRHSRNQSTDSLAQANRFSRPSDIQNDDKDLEAAIAASLKDMENETARQRRNVFSDGPSPTKMQFSGEEQRPPLPQRPSQSTISSYRPDSGSDFGDLIDLRDEEPTPKATQEPISRQPPSIPAKPAGLSSPSPSSTPRPPPPSKPVRLRSASTTSDQSTPTLNTIKPPPPRPRKPSSSVRPVSPSPLHQVQESSPVQTKAPALPERHGVRGYAMQKLNAAYNALPSAGATMNSQPQQLGTDPSYGYYHTSPRSMSVASQSPVPPADARNYHSSSRQNTAPPPPSRRTTGGVASSAVSTASRLSGYWSGQDPIDDTTGQAVNKREELWKRRWRRAKEIMDRQGVMLRTWRVGSDVMDECVAAVKSELDEKDKKGQSRPRW